MKTFRILPWYFLLLIIGLCVAMYTEGMTVQQKVIDKDFTIHSGVQLLIDKHHEYNNNNNNKNLHLLVLSDKLYGLVDKKAFRELQQNKYNYIIFQSKDDTKTNAILRRISKQQLDGNMLILTSNQKSNQLNNMYKLAEKKVSRPTESIIQKHTNSPFIHSTNTQT